MRTIVCPCGHTTLIKAGLIFISTPQSFTLTSSYNLAQAGPVYSVVFVFALGGWVNVLAFGPAPPSAQALTGLLRHSQSCSELYTSTSLVCNLQPVLVRYPLLVV